MDLRDKNVTVAGLGLHGGAIGNIKWLHKQGAHILVTDLRAKEELEPSLKALEDIPDITYILGEHRIHDFVDADLILRNPSVPRSSEYLIAAERQGVSIEMDSSFFFEHCSSNEVIGVTGSKGKTTTANAITHVLGKHEPPAVPVGVGSVGVLSELGKVTESSPVVFELSSWRLEGLIPNKISPMYAVVTSIYRDHLNTYDSFEEYIETKKAIFKYQKSDGVVVLNHDDDEISTWESEVSGKLYWYSMNEIPGDGIYVKDGEVVISIDGKEEVVMAVDDLPLRLEHERRNLLPAILLGHLFGLSIEDITSGLSEVAGLPHRMEVVGEIDGVRYINDSAATMPDATIAALQSLGESPTVHILGGNDKELEYEELAEVMKDVNIRALVWLPGTVTERMQDLVLSARPDVQTNDASSMQEAVSLASEAAQSGDTVLLSPGATSFGLFKNEFDRGDQFREAVKGLE